MPTPRLSVLFDWLLDGQIQRLTILNELGHPDAVEVRNKLHRLDHSATAAHSNGMRAG